MKDGKYLVMVVEDQEMPRQLFEQFIKQSDCFLLAISIANAEYAEIYCMNNAIDLILMDVFTKEGQNGLQAAEKIKRKYPHIKIIIVTSMPECSYIDRAKAIGVEGFWYKDTSKDTILSLMNRVIKGENVYPEMSQPVMIGLVNSTEFTKREIEILREMTGGYSNQEIGEKLGISVNVVRNHISNMLEKTGFRSRTQLAVKARSTGLVILDKSEDDID